MDSGAEISIMKPTPSDKRSEVRPEGISVDGSLCQRMAIVLWFCVKFRWIFVAVDVKHNLSEIDFLRHFFSTIEFVSS